MSDEARISTGPWRAKPPDPGATAPFVGLIAGAAPQLPGYEVLEQLPAGGMGVVYRARQITPDRVVALKMLRAGALAGPRDLARFRLEAEAVASLDHPHVVRIHDHGEWQGVPYFAMEYVEGGNLAQRLAGQPLPAAEAAALLETLARTMQFIHERGIIHRDLKPANILLQKKQSADSADSADKKGRRSFSALESVKSAESADDLLPRIADFGLAKRLDHDQGLTQSHAILGTAGYMAPEQAAGDRQLLGPGVDVYGLGAILYETLTGRPPFEAETVEAVLRQVISEDPELPSRLRPDVPPDLEAICLKCLEKDPARRFPSARALAEELRRYLDGEPLATPRLGTVAWHGRLARRGGYEVLDILGAGARGIVYRARHRSHGRVVALKMLAVRGPLDADRLARLLATIERVAQVRHASLAEVHDFGEQDREVYLVTECLEAGCLADTLGGSLPPEKVAELVEALARAVHHAHQHGLIHGRLTPDKIRLGTDGTWEITGLGLSQILEDEATRGATRPAYISGYLAPEQANGPAETVGPAADVCALGAVLYALLTGRPPVVADTLAETLEQLRNGRPEPPRQGRPEVPRGLEAICLKCLEKEPARRYPSAAALAEDLRRYRSREVLFVDDLDEWSQQQHWAQRAGYEILEPLGRGQEAFVYKARHVALDRTVVLKRLSAGHRFTLAAKGRLRREAQLLGGLRHPNFAQLIETGEQSDLTYFSREFAEGKSLIELAAEGPPSPRVAVEIVEALARALHAAHGLGIGHVGLDPSRVRRTSAGTLKITSLRRIWVPEFIKDESRPAGEVCRRLNYRAPEELPGGQQRPGPAADVYTLGAVLYTLLTGRLLFAGPGIAETLEQVQTAVPLPPERDATALPAELTALCVQCLAKQPAARPASALVLADQLRRLLNRKRGPLRP